MSDRVSAANHSLRKKSEGKRTRTVFHTVRDNLCDQSFFSIFMSFFSSFT